MLKSVVNPDHSQASSMLSTIISSSLRLWFPPFLHNRIWWLSTWQLNIFCYKKVQVCWKQISCDKFVMIKSGYEKSLSVDIKAQLYFLDSFNENIRKSFLSYSLKSLVQLLCFSYRLVFISQFSVNSNMVSELHWSYTMESPATSQTNRSQLVKSKRTSSNKEVTWSSVESHIQEPEL